MTFLPYATALAWGALVCVSFAGFGRAADRAFGSDPTPPDFFEQAAWGLALSLVAGGVFNYFHLVSRTFLFGWIACGVVCFVFFRRPASCSPGRALSPVICLLGFLAAYHYAGNAWQVQFNEWDDRMVYMTYPRQMLAEGGLGAAFSSHWLVSGFSGHYFLNAIVLSALAEENFHLIDPGLAFVLGAGLVYRLASRAGLSRNLAAVPVCVLLLVPFMVSNASPSFSIFVLIPALFLALDEDRPPRRRIFFSAVLLAGLASLKGTYLTEAGVFWCVYTAFRLAGSRDRGAAWSEALWTAAMAALCLFPWMAALHRSSGTFLFPILGKGFHVSSYGEPFPRAAAGLLRHYLTLWIKHPLTLCVEAMAAVVLFRAVFERSQMQLRAAACVVSLFLSSGIIMYLTLFPDNFHLVFTLLLTAFAVGLAAALAPAPAARWKAYAALSLTPFALWMFTTRGHMVTLFFYSMPATVADGWSGRLSETRKFQPEADRMQAAAVPGEKILACLKENMLLDYRRNRVLVAEFPGVVSPPPGWPLHEEAEKVAEYLRSQSIRYVAFSEFLGEDGVFHPDPTNWNHKDFELLYESEKKFFELSRRYDTVSVGDRRFNLIDLRTPRHE